ncbi:hypothetical protein BD770DRAFT_399093 [Pilaira anomala]|nr:hypothetical protein BD770DRAFT_399093 [Pilaira anomala]
MTEQIFANNFWGLKDDGFHALTAKMSSTKKTFDEIKSFYNVRATLHEEFGRKLMKHAKVGMGREETGTLQALLSSAHKETEWTAQAHLNLAQKLKTRLEVDLDNFILEQKDKRKLASTNVEKAHRYKQSNEAYLAKVKEKYESDCAKLITLQAQIVSATGREADRMKQRIDRTQHEIKIQEQEYKNACMKVADATRAWNQTWKLTCDTYQGMEKKRLEFLRHSFSMYINILSTATSQDQESYERFWKSLDQYDPVNDIQIFIQEKGTGPKIPEPEIFVDYMDDPTKTFQKHTIADFPCPPELFTDNNEPPSSNIIQPPELTVRNPTTVEDSSSSSLLLKRIKSITISSKNNEEPVVVTKSTSNSIFTPAGGRKKSCFRNVVKPLPSINSSSSSSIPPPPILNIPEISCSSSSSSEDDTNSRKKQDDDDEDEGDITIDPRAKVVFAIGNNMFDLGHLSQQQESVTVAAAATAGAAEKKEKSIIPRRLTSRRRRQPSADLEAACNFSYQSLLEELGVFDKGNNNQTDEKKKVVTTTPKRVVSQRTTVKQHYQPTTELNQTADMVYNGTPMIASPVVQQQDVYSSSMSNDPYSRVQQQQYYNQYALQQQPAATPMIAQQPVQGYISGVYNNPSAMVVPTTVGHQPTLFWVQTLCDWYNGKAEELQYARGTWLAVTEIGPDGWFYATKFDSRLNTLTNEKGYVAKGYVQVHA